MDKEIFDLESSECLGKFAEEYAFSKGCELSWFEGANPLISEEKALHVKITPLNPNKTYQKNRRDHSFTIPLGLSKEEVIKLLDEKIKSIQ
ncbi:hypothetical protein [Bacillus haynesii]|uniref:hypothetical protein n=1 Tax=Bacillus haynesii TaxID=1925021 RepID=UPI00227DC2E6|nr:hypothetical protein [Bacillus haynesii]MCY8641262.1 hypothetical protein [Bacillus haynesii]